MATSLLRNVRTMDVGRLMGAAILVGLLACTDRDDRSRSPAPLPDALAVSGPMEIETGQVPIADVASAIKAGLDNGRDPVFRSLTLVEREELTTL